MNDQQLKIRIKLNQLPQLLDNETQEEITDQTKPPFDWRKISLAVLLIVSVLSGGLYWLLTGGNSQNIIEPLPTKEAEDAHFIENNGLAPNNKTESNAMSADKASMTPDIITDVMEVMPQAKPVIRTAKPASKPIVEATTNPQLSIIPSRKPESD